MKINYLRVSVTDCCNLNCIYCRPLSLANHVPRSKLLRFEEIRDFVALAVQWGIDKVRITGGEPLVRNNIVNLVEILSQIKGIRDLTMTTNGVRLEEFAQELKQAGLSRINVSLDSLDRERFTHITGYDKLLEVLRGIKAARKVGLDPVKINVVILKGVNEEEILKFVSFGLEQGLIIRFIEYMPIGGIGQNNRYLPNNFAKEIIERKWGGLEPLSSYNGSPAKYFKIRGTHSRLGFINSISRPFCSSCSRLRLTAKGELRPCLFTNFGVNLKKALGKKDKETKREEIKALFDLAVRNKVKRELSSLSNPQKKHQKAPSKFNSEIKERSAAFIEGNMFQIGG